MKDQGDNNQPSSPNLVSLFARFKDNLKVNLMNISVTTTSDVPTHGLIFDETKCDWADLCPLTTAGNLFINPFDGRQLFFSYNSTNYTLYGPDEKLVDVPYSVDIVT